MTSPEGPARNDLRMVDEIRREFDERETKAKKAIEIKESGTNPEDKLKPLVERFFEDIRKWQNDLKYLPSNPDDTKIWELCQRIASTVLKQREILGYWLTWRKLNIDYFKSRDATFQAGKQLRDFINSNYQVLDEDELAIPIDLKIYLSVFERDLTILAPNDFNTALIRRLEPLAQALENFMQFI